VTVTVAFLGGAAIGSEVPLTTFPGCEKKQGGHNDDQRRGGAPQHDTQR
jgi:hypothetical protein